MFPNILKTSKIIPTHKKDSKLNYLNYCLIFLLSNIDKILERIMYNRLYTFFEKSKLIYSFQISLRQKHSATHALIYLTELIRKQLDDGNYVCGIFVNFQKAFDTVDHNILYSIRTISNKGFASYLTNRNQFVNKWV